MKLVLKFGGTSLASPKDIINVAKTIASFSKGNQIVVVCSAVDGVTDSLILISTMIEQRKKKEVADTLDELVKKLNSNNIEISSLKEDKKYIDKKIKLYNDFFVTILNYYIKEIGDIGNNSVYDK